MPFRHKFNSHRIFKRLAKALIRSEALLVAHTTLLEISCTGSYNVARKPVFGVSVKASLKPVSSAKGTSWHIEICLKQV